MRKVSLQSDDSIKAKHLEAEKLLSNDFADTISKADIVSGSQPLPTPTSVRLSTPLLEAIDRLAASQHRKRGNMIQHILWEYVTAHSESGTPTAPSAR